MNNEKYVLTDERKEIRVHGKQTIVVSRIKAMKDFTTYALVRRIKYSGEKRSVVYKIEPKLIRAGQLGGFVQSEINLSQDGSCWIDDDAVAFGKSLVVNEAYLGDHAGIGDFVVACDNTKITDVAQVGGKIILCGRSKVVGNGWYHGEGSYKDVCLNKKVKRNSTSKAKAQVQKTQKTKNLKPSSPQGRVKIECQFGDKKFVNDFEF